MAELGRCTPTVTTVRGLRAALPIIVLVIGAAMGVRGGSAGSGAPAFEPAAAHLPPALPEAGATWVSLSGHRILDTASGLGHTGAVGANSTVAIQVTGVAGVPASGVSSVALELTAVAPSATSFVKVFPAGAAVPVARALSTQSSVTTTSLVHVRPGIGGKVSIYNYAGTTNLRAEVVGYATSPNWVVVENAKAGTTGWRLGAQGSATAIVGFADRTSVSPGGSFGLYVETTAASWKVTAYRMGWYHGTGGRRVWATGWHAARYQPVATTSGATRTVTASWCKSLTITTSGWPEGSYLLKLRSSAGYERYVPLTVRSATTANRMVFMNEDLMWQAYNAWGGRSLYTGPSGYSSRSYAVSFDRPYDRNGAVKFLYFEQPLIARAERLGLPLAYLTEIDVSNHPTVLEHATTVIIPGHDEYWTWNQRDAVLSARSHGANILIFGANTQYWQVRLASTSLGGSRKLICYKTDVALDPASRTDPERETTLWRNLPSPKPESRIVGLMYEGFPAEARYVVSRPSFFAFRGTGAVRGTSFPGLVGVEIDRAYSGSATPANLVVVAHSPVSCHGRSTYSDSAYYVASSGAAVFATGTMRWINILGGGRSSGVTDATINFVRTVTDNLLVAFATHRAGRLHPA